MENAGNEVSDTQTLLAEDPQTPSAIWTPPTTPRHQVQRKHWEVSQRENDSALTCEEASEKTNTAQQANEEPMIVPVSGEGQLELTSSPQGRQRRKNPRFLDYEMERKPDAVSPEQKRPRRTLTKENPVNGEAPVKTPAKRGRPRKTLKPPEADDQEATSHEAAGKTLQKSTPRKTPARKTPAKKNTASRTDPSTAEAECADTVQQAEEPPKPKRKYVRKQLTRGVAPVEIAALQKEDREQTPTAAEEETTPSGRPRRGAAKVALKYLHSLAQEYPDESEPSKKTSDGSPDSLPKPVRKGPRGGKAGAKGRKRKRPDDDSDNTAEDEDFVPDAEEDMEAAEDLEEEETESSSVESDLEPSEKSKSSQRLHKSIQSQAKQYGKAANGLPNNMMKPVWDSYNTNKTFRDEHCSSWVFPEWVPSVNDWRIVPQSELYKYLPLELQSAAFKVSREGLSKEETLHRLNRFETVEAHPERWDSFLFAGGPVWALEWCPSPDGAPADQYLALACHQGMDDQHFKNHTYKGHGLVQVWNMGKMEYNSRPESCPSLAYCLGQDKGFVWQLKWCPAGAWELPTCSRKAPFLPRLGLLAAATSTGVVTIYSLPHPEALRTSMKLPNSGEDGQDPPVFQAQGALTLKLGAFKAPHHEKSGQVLCLDWLPNKPHNILAIGFYDGIIGLWDLSSKSSLLRLREPDHSLTLLPYRCFLAHDNAVRTLCFSPVSRYLLVTGGDDRMVKTWDLKRIYEPITVHKRNLSTEVYWPLRAPGMLLAQESAYVPRGLHGVHFHDSGYHNSRSIFITPRVGTVWSISFSDWLNSLVTSDSLGEVIVALLPDITNNHHHIRRTIERRFPMYFTDMVPYSSDAARQDGEDEETQEIEEARQGGGKKGVAGGGDESCLTAGQKESPATDSVPPQPQTYRDAVKKYYLHFHDNDMRTFKNYQKRAPWKRMQATELKANVDLDVLPMAALHKIRFNPNMSCHTWVASAGQAGLVRLQCLQGLTGPHIHKAVRESQTQFSALYSPGDGGGPEAGPEAVTVALTSAEVL